MEIGKNLPAGVADTKSNKNAAAATGDDAFASLLHACQQSAGADKASEDEESKKAGPGDWLNEPLMLPTRENVEKLTRELACDLRDFFTNAGIERQPTVEFKVDPFNGKVSVETDRADKAAIEKALRADPKLELKIHNVAAIASHIEPMEESLEFQAAYRRAKSPAEVNRVVQQFSHLFDNRPSPTHTYSLQFDGDATSLLEDGRAWGVE
jgi:hypothetical protein